MKPEHGKISQYLEVPDLIVRAVPSYGVTSEFDGGTYDSSDSEMEDYGPAYEDRLQGRLVNATKHRLSDIKYCLLYTSPSPRDKRQSRMPSSA